jgi:uncharacterized membrane protein
MYFLVGFIVFISQVGYALFYGQLDSLSIVRISLIAAIALSIILIPLVVMYILFDKQYLALFFGCHQKKERSYHLKDFYLPLCARCSGILIGIYLSILVFLFNFDVLWILLLMLPLLIDGVIQRLSNYESKNLIRLFTGMLFAPGFVVLYGLINYYIHYGFTEIAKVVVTLF